jgi:hypothetical protein
MDVWAKEAQKTTRLAWAYNVICSWAIYNNEKLVV